MESELISKSPAETISAGKKIGKKEILFVWKATWEREKPTL
jgi:hypothetical protein